MTSISAGAHEERNVSGVPQSRQNARVPWSDETSSAGMPAVTAKSATGTVNQATLGAPDVRRQMVQWQIVSHRGTAVTR